MQRAFSPFSGFIAVPFFASDFARQIGCSHATAWAAANPKQTGDNARKGSIDGLLATLPAPKLDTAALLDGGQPPRSGFFGRILHRPRVWAREEITVQIQ